MSSLQAILAVKTVSLRYFRRPQGATLPFKTSTIQDLCRAKFFKFLTPRVFLMLWQSTSAAGWYKAQKL